MLLSLSQSTQQNLMLLMKRNSKKKQSGKQAVDCPIKLETEKNSLTVSMAICIVSTSAGEKIKRNDDTEDDVKGKLKKNKCFKMTWMTMADSNRLWMTELFSLLILIFYLIGYLLSLDTGYELTKVVGLIFPCNIVPAVLWAHSWLVPFPHRMWAHI